jgi:hypothetical protein
MRSEKPKATLRCAVYTRVSTEHGLEQEFNSARSCWGDENQENAPILRSSSCEVWNGSHQARNPKSADRRLISAFAGHDRSSPQNS